ncbi:MAG: translational machinery protein [Betaproteobacteria bacterium]
MQADHVVVWLDHNAAHIIAFSRDTAEAPVIVHSPQHNVHQHQRSDRNAPTSAVAHPEYYESIIARIRKVPEWLIVGPANAKLNFSKHLNKRHADLVDHVIGMETVDHPSDGQLLGYARKYFASSGRTAGVAAAS